MIGGTTEIKKQALEAANLASKRAGSRHWVAANYAHFAVIYKSFGIRERAYLADRPCEAYERIRA